MALEPRHPTRDSREAAQNGRARIVFGRALRWTARLTASILVAIAVAAGLLFARLGAGPLRIPGAAEFVAAAVSDRTQPYEVRIGSIELTPGDGNALAGVRLIDAAVHAPDGTLLTSVPGVVSELDLRNLARGGFRPRKITLIRPKLDILRTADGRIRAGFDDGRGIGGGSAAGEAAQGAARFDAFVRAIDGFVGDLEPAPGLSRLETLLIRGIDLTFRDEGLNRTWRVADGDLRIKRTDAGATARLTAAVGAADGDRIPIEIAAARLKGTGSADVTLRFTDLTPGILPEGPLRAAWQNLIEGRFAGSASVSVARDGRVGPITGNLTAERGKMTVTGATTHPFELIDMDYRYLPRRERFEATSLKISSPALTARLSGSLDLLRGPGDDGEAEVEGVAARVEVGKLRVAPPDVFAGPLTFDGGLISARAFGRDGARIDAQGFLRNGDMRFTVDGRLRGRPGARIADIRAAGRNVSIAALVSHWPPAVAANAREWIDENIPVGRIDRMTTHLRLGAGAPELDLEFAFSGLEAEYIDGMSPLREAAGRGRLTLDDFHLFLDRGGIVPGDRGSSEDGRIALDGSSLTFRNLREDAPPAEIALTGAGDLNAILALLDEEPAALMRRIDLDPSGIRGRAEVGAMFVFPLLRDLTLDQVEVRFDAELADVRMSLDPAGRRLDAAGDRMTIAGSDREMTVSGDVIVDGAPLALIWTERYGEGVDRRDILAKGPVTPKALERFGLKIPGFEEGSALVDLTLRQDGAPAYEFDLSADLTEAPLVLPQLDWRKAAGEKATLTLEGRYEETLRIGRADFKADGLEAGGRFALDENGALQSADLDRFRLREDADLAVGVTRTADGLEADLRGRYLDLEPVFDLADDDGAGAPLSARFRIEEIRVADGYRLREAEGWMRRTGGTLRADVSGLVGSAALTAQYAETDGAPGSLSVQSRQAGELAEHLGLYEGARGGELNMIAEVGPRSGADLSGLVKIRGVGLTRGEGLRTILTTGRFATEQVEEVEDGLVFGSVRAPFRYADGEFTLDGGFAKSPSLAITARGTLNPGADRIDLAGVISPAYVLTSAIDNLPILGRILTGNEGEGLLGMTFTMTGSLDDPQVEVNPLSLLAPGILRGIFSTETGAADR